MPLLTNELLQCLKFYGPMTAAQAREKLNLREGNNYSEGDVRILLGVLLEVRQVTASVIDGQKYFKPAGE
jgi:hypothetical protein